MSSSPSLDPWLGRSLGERQRYRLDQRLGSGGMAEVFLAMDVLLGQPVALKLLNEKLATGEMRRRFEQEVALCAALRSEHIVRVSDHGVTPEGYPFFVMEYLHGQTLRQLLHQERRLSVERSVNIITQVCEGLHLAHQGIELQQSNSSGLVSSQPVKVVHRDLKPDNIFLVSIAFGELVKILDFGIAKIRSNQAEGSNATTVFLGTYRYAAPEQFEINKDLDERADIYSLGLILYEMLSGTDPFGFGALVKQASGGTWAVAHLNKPVLPLREQLGCEHLPPELDAIVMQCLQKDPQQRFASVRELGTALRTVTGMTNLSPLSPTHSSFATATPASDLNSPTLSTQHYWQTASVEEPVSVSDSVPHSATHLPTQLTAPIFSASVSQPKSSQPKSSQSKSRLRSAFSSNQSLLSWSAALTTGAFALGFGVYSSSQFSISSSLKREAVVPQATAPSQPSLDLPATPTSAKAKTFTGHADTVWAVALTPDNQTVISGGFDRTIRLWNQETGAALRVLTGHTDAVRTIAVSSDGQIIASGSSDKTIKIWRLQTGELLRTLTGHSGPIWSIAISPDGQTLASGSYDGTIKLWEVQTGKLLRTLPDHYDSVWSVAISPDGQTLASGSYDGMIKLWNLQTGALLRTLSGHTEAVRSVDISSDGQMLASGSWDKTVRIWNLQTGELLHTLTGHADRVVSVALAPSGQTLASGSLDRTIRLWDIQTGQSLQTLSEHTAWVVSLAYGSTQETLASGSKDQTVKVWQFAPVN